MSGCKIKTNMNYKLVYITPKSEYQTYIESVSEEEYDKIMDCISKLQSAMLAKDYFTIVKDNINDLVSFYTKMDVMGKENFPTLNRLTYNILAVFYAWIEYYESNYKSIFAPIKSKYYDNHFSYRMMYNLRTFMTHCEMAVTEMQVHFDEGEFFVYIEPTKLLANSGRLQKSFLPELQTMANNGQKIDLEKLINDFSAMFSDIHKELLKALEPEIQNILNEMKPYLKLENGALMNCCLQEKDTSKHVYSISSFLGLFINKMAES